MDCARENAEDERVTHRNHVELVVWRDIGIHEGEEAMLRRFYRSDVAAQPGNSSAEADTWLCKHPPVEPHLFAAILVSLRFHVRQHVLIERRELRTDFLLGQSE